jgi:hypothetical protein
VPFRDSDYAKTHCKLLKSCPETKKKINFFC